MIGKVIKYDRSRSFGFILPEDPTQPDYFVHRTQIQGGKTHQFLIVGQIVEFDPAEDSEGRPQAHNVRVTVPPTATVALSSGKAVRP